MKCSNPNCGQSLTPGWKACPFCQTPVSTQHKCDHCNADLQPEWKACPYCRKPASIMPERSAYSPSQALTSFCQGCGTELTTGSGQSFKCDSCGGVFCCECRVEHPNGTILPFCATCGFDILAPVLEQLKKNDFEITEDAVQNPQFDFLADMESHLKKHEEEVKKNEEALNHCLLYLKSNDWEIRCLGIENIYKIRHGDVPNILLDVIKNDDDDDVREKAKQCLLSMTPEIASIWHPKITALLLNCEDWEIRQETARSLRNIDLYSLQDSRIFMLIDTIHEDEDSDVQQIAADSLIYLISNAKRYDEEIFKKIMQCEDYNIRCHLVKKAGELQDRSALPLLLDALNNDDDDDVRQMAKDAFIEINP